MTNLLAGINIGIWLDTLAGFNVHVQNIPAGLLIAIVIQILDHCAVLGAHDPSICHRDHPGVTAHTTRGSPGGAKSIAAQAEPVIPAAMRTAGE